MAFPLPEHLPRRAFPSDGQAYGSSTSYSDPILRKISEASFDTLTAQLATSWVTELTGGIELTKKAIRTQVQTNLPDFQRQLRISTSIHERVVSLSSSTDHLQATLHAPETGLLPTLARKFATHAALSQQARDSQIKLSALSHAAKCRDTLHRLSSLVIAGQLPEAITTSNDLRDLINSSPDSFAKSTVLLEIKRKSRGLADHLEEQLGNTYARAITFKNFPAGTTLAINQSTAVSKSSNILPLPELLTSFSSQSLSERLTSFRKDVLAKFVDSILQKPSHVATEDTTLILSHTSSSDPIVNLTTLITFLHEHLFSVIPPSHSRQTPALMIPPLTEAVVSLLRRSMPTTLSALPSYLKLVHDAVNFEDHLHAMSGLAGPSKITEWAESIGSHYEKKRREDIMEIARRILSDEKQLAGSRVERTLVVPPTPLPVPVTSPTPDFSAETLTAEDEANWDFEAEEPVASVSAAPAPILDPEPISAPEEEEEDGWGFDEDDATPGDLISTEVVEEDPWDEGWADDSVPSTSTSASSPSPPQPKMAKRLEKYNAKMHPASDNTSGDFVPTPALPPASTLNHPPSLSLAPPSTTTLSLAQLRSPAILKESLLVSECAKSVLGLSLKTIEEGQDLLRSSMFAPRTPPTGTLLLASIHSIFDLFRALYPVTHATVMSVSPSLRIRFSNDCAYLAEEIGKMADEVGSEKLEETKERLVALSETWLDDCLEDQNKAITDLLQNADGFFDTADDTRYAICQSTVEDVVQNIMSTVHEWKTTLSPSAYNEAAGYVVEQTLSSVLADIISLPDIPEKESHRLNQLFKLLDPLKDLFIDSSGGESSIAAHVPSWFKFAYLSELLEASLADITYLFESSALIDFDLDELVRLIRALFSDTPLRAKTIDKILNGHPVVG